MPTDSEWTVSDDEAGTRLDKFLAAAGRAGSRARAAAALERGKVFVNGAEARLPAAARRLERGDVVRIWEDRPGSSKRHAWAGQFGELEVVYEDDALLVANKPPGLLSVPLERKMEEPSIFDQVVNHFRSHGKRRPLVVHRIDQDTSGLVVFAKTSRAQTELREQFKRREPERVYWAVVYGCPNPPSGRWSDFLVWDEKARIQKETHPRDPKADEAVSEYRVLEKYEGSSLVEIRLHTGRRNQICIQARLRGHTLVGEQRYVFGPDVLRPIPFKRQALHAIRLRFRHPITGRDVQFEAPLPQDLADLLLRLRKKQRSASRGS